MSQAAPTPITIRDVAQMAGVSIATVSLATHHPDRIAPATVVRIRAAMYELHYTPLRIRKNSGISAMVLNQLGVLFPHPEDHSCSPDISPFDIIIAKGANERMVRRGAQLLISQVSPSDDVPTMLSGKHVSGVIARSGFYSANILSALNGIPMVWVMGAAPIIDGIDLVSVNNFSHGVKAARFLLGRGVRSVKVILPEHNLTEEHHQRHLGCLLELERSGVGAQYSTPLSFLKEIQFHAMHSTGIYITGDDDDITLLYQRMREDPFTPSEMPPLVCTIMDEEKTRLLNDGMHKLYINPLELGRVAVDRLIWKIDNPNEAPATILIPPLELT